ncbi:MAG: HEAT repeat domain-containing protein [Planctomycetes bacterium]|nr:HEAT repeat domain-containing protein [Planctomycetota bacterium]
MCRPIVLLVAVFASLVAPLAAQTAAERAEALKEFRRFFKKFKSVEEQVEAVRTLRDVECVAAAEELVELFGHATPEVAVTAREVLASYRDPASFAPLVEALPKLKDQTRRAEIVEALGKAQIRDAMPTVIDIAKNDKKATPELRFAAARALAACKFVEGSEPLLAALLADADPLVRMGAVESIGVLKASALGKAVVERLDDSAWQVQVAAVKTLATLREPAAVAPMIELMRKGGRLEEEIADALFKITALDFGRDADAWKTTWDRLSAIPGWRIPTDDELAKAAASRQKYDALYGKTKDGVTSFGGVPTTSRRMLFIIDVSGSMADLVVEREKFDTGYRDFEKLTIVKAELLNTIDSLGEDVLFNICAFATATRTWKPGLVRANVVNRASAKAFVERLEPIGGPEAQAMAGAGLVGSANLGAGKTNTYAALVFPFGVDPEAKDGAALAEDRAMQNEVDTVFFLSDGRPSTGKYTDTAQILAEVTRLNERYRIVIHAIAIGEFEKNFMKILAENNGGVFVDLGR